MRGYPGALKGEGRGGAIDSKERSRIDCVLDLYGCSKRWCRDARVNAGPRSRPTLYPGGKKSLSSLARHHITLSDRRIRIRCF